MNEKLFNMDMEELVRQCNSGSIKTDTNTPIELGKTLEPCIEGGKKIIQDSELKERIKKIILGE